MQILGLNDKIIAYDINLQVAYALTIILVFVGIISLTVGLISQQTIYSQKRLCRHRTIR